MGGSARSVISDSIVSKVEGYNLFTMRLSVVGSPIQTIESLSRDVLKQTESETPSE